MEKELTIAIDWDDVICPLNAVAIQIYNERAKGEKLTLNHICDWSSGEKLLEPIYRGMELYDRQRPLPEWLKVIPELNEMGKVIIATNPYPEHYAFRRNQIHHFFPLLKEDQIRIGPGKEGVPFTFLLDDNDGTVRKSKAKYPLLFDQPWNRDYKGERVQTPEDFFQYVMKRIGKEQSRERGKSMSYVITNTFSTALHKKGYHFLARETDKILHAFQTEPTWNGTAWEAEEETPLVLTEDTIEQKVKDWNLENEIPDASDIHYEWIKEKECVRI